MAIYEVVGDVMGEGDDYYVGAEAPAAAPRPGSWRNGPQQHRQVAVPPGHQAIVVPKRPAWRDGQLAPGVMQPDEGMVPLGMNPDNGTGIFAAGGASKITWQGQLQKPFRAERLLVSSVRTGTTATGRLLGQFFVGVDLNMATIQPVDIELFGSPSAFGTRLTLMQAPPGVVINVPVTMSAFPTGTDTVFASVQFAGRIVH